MSLDNIRVVLVRPLYGGNMGSVCRALANCGMSDLALVRPRKLNMQEARMMACAAEDNLNNRKEFDSLEDAVADCNTVMGATARLGLYRSHSGSPREQAPVALEGAATGKTALVFGPEDSGLTNEDLAICSHIIQIPSAPEYLSLNLAQAVMICCYEVYVASGQFEPSAEKSDIASTDVKERMFAMWRETLFTVGFFDEQKADHMMLGFRRIMSRGARTLDDVRIMMGIARQSAWAAGEKARLGKATAEQESVSSDQ